MSIRWERFAGDTSSFAVRLAFHRDPDEGAGATPEMTESWGALQIWVRGKNLCAHIDQGETLLSSHWYLLPLLEWLSANWDPLLHEERPPAGRTDIHTAADVSGLAAAMTYLSGDDNGQLDEFGEQFDWQERHALRAASDGGIFPDVRLRRFRDQVEISWAARTVPGAEDVQFLSPEGVDYVSPTTVAQPLYEVLECAAEWLREQLPDSKQCSALVEAVGALSSHQRTEGRTAWLASLGTHRGDVAVQWRRITEFG